MAKSSRPSSQKRAREKARAEKNKAKEARRMERRERQSNAEPRVNGEDPDLAGIQPGPQPRPDWLDLPEDEEDETGEENE